MSSNLGCPSKLGTLKLMQGCTKTGSIFTKTSAKLLQINDAGPWI